MRPNLQQSVWVIGARPPPKTVLYVTQSAFSIYCTTKGGKAGSAGDIRATGLRPHQDIQIQIFAQTVA